VHCYAHDITEKRQAEESARSALLEKSAAEAANSAKSAFLANVSHEIRTPLTAIIGFSESLLDTDQNMQQRINAIHTIIQAGRHLLSVINDILDLSKIEASKLDIENLRTDIFTLVRDVHSLAGMHAESKGIALKVNYHFPLPAAIYTDPLRLKQILLNLVNNAIKFTEKGCVDLAVRLDSQRELLHFDVRDTGIGMDKEALARLFSPFSQADSSTTRKFGGTGLGLYLSRMLAEKLGGDITVSSTPGQGSHFSVSVATGALAHVALVMSPPSKTAIAQSPAAASIRVMGKVLLAEDNSNNQLLISHYLRKLGAEVTIANNGAEALEQARAGDFDLILMDMQMPVMDGLEAIRQLRGSGYTRPIVSLTANVMQSDIENCLSAGSNDFLAKPIETEKFNATVGGYLKPQPPAHDLTPVNSQLLAEFPEMLELVSSFIAGLPAALDSLRSAYQAGDWRTLKAKVHDLKSVGGGYGYPQVTQVAGKIEFELAKEDYGAVEHHFKELESLQQRILLGRPVSA
jgi:CheY-like chemotaxis protein/nitrogen-specific signal transduction histidine kinase